MSGLHFIRPEWLAVIPLGLLTLWLLARARRRMAGVWAKFVDPALQPHVLVGGSVSPRTAWPWWLAALAVLLSGLALAGPAWQQLKVPATRSGDAMVILLDLSRSMDATDVAPSRLIRARLKLLDILRERAGGETALVVFSANAFVVTPLTDDTDTIAALVPTLTTDLMPSQGSYPESGIVKAMQLFEQAGVGEGHILLIGDGGNLPPAMTAAREARAQGHELSILAIGTPEGGPIPAQRGGFVTDDRGRMAVPKLPLGGLQRLATAGGGQFATLTSNAADLRALDVDAGLSARATDSSEQQSIERWADQGVWLLLPVLLIASAAFRRGGPVLVVALIAVMPTQRAEAFSWQDLWLNDNQQAARALQDGEAERAAELFEDPAWKASAAYRAGDYGDSATLFAGLEGADARYNAGNALARDGKIALAIGAYKAALAIDPGHEDARFNLALLESLEDDESDEQQGSDPSGEPQDGESGEGADGNSGQSADAAGQQGQDGSPGDSDDEGQQASGDPQQEQEDIEALQEQLRQAQADPQSESQAAMTAEQLADAEQQQALEQWLRRVPDDPGGLLRRKFRFQYQRRQQDQDGNPLWPDDRAEPW